MAPKVEYLGWDGELYAALAQLVEQLFRLPASRRAPE